MRRTKANVFWVAGFWVAGAALGFAAPCASASTIVSYVVTAGGTNGAGYSPAVLAAPWQLRFAYDTRIPPRAAADPTITTYPPGSNQVFMELRIGNDIYVAGGAGLPIGNIVVTHPVGSSFDTLNIGLSTAGQAATMQLDVRYPTVVPESLPESLPSSSFQFDPNLSSLLVVRSTLQDFYQFDLGTLRPALSPFCPPDFNLSGSLSVQDLFDFLAAYFANQPLADFNGSGASTVQDIFDYLAAYFAGCS